MTFCLLGGHDLYVQEIFRQSIFINVDSLALLESVTAFVTDT